MKIIHLNESGTMKFKKARDYVNATPDAVLSSRNKNPEKNKLFLISDKGTFSLEMSIYKLTDILMNNDCPTPVLLDKSQSKMFEELKRIQDTKSLR